MSLKKPEISRITDFEGGEPIQIFGENFTSESKVYLWRPQWAENKLNEEIDLPGSAVFPDAPVEGALVYSVDDVQRGQVICVSAQQGIKSGTSLIWVENDAGFSKPFIANAPQVWFQSVNTIYPKGIVTLYGNNFWSSLNKRAVFKDVKTGEFFKTDIMSPFEHWYPHDCHRHSTPVEVPENLKDGEYELYLHNGIGSQFGWANPVKVTVSREYSATEYHRTLWNRDTGDEIPVPETKMFVVKANELGAYYDITDELQSACDEAAKQGGTVLLTAGIYGITRTLKVRKGVILKGAGKGATTIRPVYGCKIAPSWDEINMVKRPSGGRRWANDWKQLWQDRDIAPPYPPL